MRSVVVIPARWGSTRFPGKPLAEIAGKPLIRHVWERASRSSADAVWIATDDERIHEAAEQFGGRVVMTASDHPSGTDRVAAAVREVEPDAAIVVNVQGDEPLIDPGLIDRIIDALKRSDADVVTLSAPMGNAEEHARPDVVKVVTSVDGNALYFSRAAIPHEAHEISRRHVGIYGFRAGALEAFPRLEHSSLEKAERLEQLRLLENGFKIKVLETDELHLGVDRPEDIGRVEAEIARTSR